MTHRWTRLAVYEDRTHRYSWLITDHKGGVARGFDYLTAHHAIPDANNTLDVLDSLPDDEEDPT